MNSLVQDVRFGVRVLWKNPGFTMIAIITLALGIGATTAVFSIINGVLLHPLPFPEPEQLVQLRMRDFRTSMISIPNLLDWREQSRSFVDMGVYYRGGGNLSGLDRPQRVSAVYASASLLQVLGVDAMIGRIFSAESTQPGSEKAALISESFWRRHYGDDPEIVGQRILLEGTTHIVLGVLPHALERAWGRFDVWLPWVMDPSKCQRGNYSYQAVGRLKPGVTVAEARAELEALSIRLAQAYPDTNVSSSGQPRIADLVRFVDARVGARGRSLLLIVSAAVMCVLLIACVNVANLFLVKASIRQKEFALRSALGAGRGRLVRQLLTEGVLLSLAGGLLGVMLGFWGVDFITTLLPPYLTQAHEVSSSAVPQTEYHLAIDQRVLLFTIAISLATAFLFGLAPAVRSSGVNVNEALKEGGPSVFGGTLGRHGRDLLVVGEIALALALVACAGLLIQSSYALQAVPPGFDADQVLTMRVELGGGMYRSPERRVTFFRQAIRQIRQAPGVVSAAAAHTMPLGGRTIGNMSRIEGYAGPDGPQVRLGTTAITTDYFKTMGIPLLKGRDFNVRDNRRGEQVIIVNQHSADQFWPDGDVIGKHILRGTLTQTVIGVVGNVRQDGLDQEVGFETYRPYPQEPWEAGMTFVVRTVGDPLGATKAVRTALRGIDPDLPLFQVCSMKEIVSAYARGSRTIAGILTAFAATALLLAAVGLYGVMSYSVSQRTREIGIRMALGARSGSVRRLILARSAFLALCGIGGGLAIALLLSSFLRTLLYGVSAADPITLASVSVLLAAVALGSCYIPASRATKVDPMVALRYE